MSKHETLLRHQKIISKLRNSKFATYSEISSYLEYQSELLEYKLVISQRTLQRDLNEIRSLYNIDIQFDRTKGSYYIYEEDTESNNRLMEAFDLISAIKVSDSLNQFIHFEKRKPIGTHHLYGLLHAIRNRLVIELTHKKFDVEVPVKRKVEPYALKESRGRWYLVAKEPDARIIKTYGLDRIIDFHITRKHFTNPEEIDMNQVFRYSFGVINTRDGIPEDIILSFDSEQGKFIKSYPFHESQTILIDDESELRIKLSLFITHDLVMEILSYAERVKVLAPGLLIDKIREHHTRAMKIYSDE